MKSQPEKYEKEHISFVRKHAAECTLFLRRDHSFPLQKPCSIAAFGSGVRHTVKGGTGSGEVNSRFSVTIEQGLKYAGFTLTTENWLDEYDVVLADARKKFVAQVQSGARTRHQNIMLYALGKIMPAPEYEIPLTFEGDAAIYVVSRECGEGADRSPKKGDVLLTDSEVRDILELNSRYEKFLLVLNTGAPVDLSPVMEVQNILLLSQLGAVTGIVLADILLGKADPSGKLTTTWARWDDYCTLGTFGQPDDTRYAEGIYVGYRYFGTVKKKALFPFGYGQSYTEFSVLPEEIHAGESEADLGTISVKCEIRNIGNVSGRGTAQLYVSVPNGRQDHPYQMLAGFCKSKVLNPWESVQEEIRFPMSDLASYDADRACWYLEKGSYILRVGTDSEDTFPAGVIVIPEEKMLYQTQNCLGMPDFKDFRPDRDDSCQNQEADCLRQGNDDSLNQNDVSQQENDNSEKDSSSELPRLILTDEFCEACCSRWNTLEEEKNDPYQKLADTLSDEELAFLCMGAAAAGSGLSGIVGNAGTKVAGTAGETTSLLKDRGVQPLVMSDGPAGIRLARKYYEDEAGAHPVGTSSMPESVQEYVSGPMKLFLNALGGTKKMPKDAEVKSHYATALPIGTAVAQSFDTKLAEQFGDIVGDEMERFGIHLWLAPAMNIHRSILCGRNFEYYSEDPFVSGKMAAAMTRGVQRHKGCGVTIKHFAANNQENQRYTNNSMVSERAMREIYLRGFEICVREAQPKAVMTSYNLLNGVHTAEFKELIGQILRQEFGFRGVVMTDWIVEMSVNKHARYRGTRADYTIRAGSDLFMPGSDKDYKILLKAIKIGLINRDQLCKSAGRILKLSAELNEKK